MMQTNIVTILFLQFTPLTIETHIYNKQTNKHAKTRMQNSLKEEYIYYN